MLLTGVWMRNHPNVGVNCPSSLSVTPSESGLKPHTRGSRATRRSTAKGKCLATRGPYPRSGHQTPGRRAGRLAVFFLAFLPQFVAPGRGSTAV